MGVDEEYDYTVYLGYNCSYRIIGLIVNSRDCLSFTNDLPVLAISYINN